MFTILRSGRGLPGRLAASGVRWQTTSSRTGTKSWRLRSTYVFPILLFSAVSSLAINVRNAKDDARLLEDQHAAQLSVLRDLLNRLLAGENLSQQQLLKEYERVGIVKRTDGSEGKLSKTITWRETLFGRKKEERDLESERQEMADIEEAFKQAAEAPVNGVPASKRVDSPKEAISASLTRPLPSKTVQTEAGTNTKAKNTTTVLI